MTRDVAYQSAVQEYGMSQAEIVNKTAMQFVRHIFSDTVCQPFTDDFELVKTYKWKRVPPNWLSQSSQSVRRGADPPALRLA